MSNLKIPFGLLNNKLVCPSEVVNGLKCNCICPGCRKPLVGNHPKSKSRAKYFSHYSKDNCKNGYESALHLAAKRVLLEEKKILVPSIYAESTSYDHELGINESASESIESRFVNFEFVEEEVRTYEGIVPDIVAISSGKTIFIEIAVTHFVDEKKLQKLESLQIPTLEVFLDPESKIPSLDEIKELVISAKHNRDWLVNPKLNNLKKKVKAAAQNKLSKAKDRELSKLQAIKNSHENYRKLSDKQKLDYEIKKLKIPFIKISSIVGKNAKGGRSFNASNTVWQLSIYRRFIHGKRGNYFSKDDALNWLKKRFDVQPQFKNAPEIAVYYYLKYLSKTKILTYSYSDYYVDTYITDSDLPE